MLIAVLLVTLSLGVRQSQVTSSTHPPPPVAAGGVGEAAGRNVWHERREFYTSAAPRDVDEEQKMLQAALELSKLEYRKSSSSHDSSSVLSLHSE